MEYKKNKIPDYIDVWNCFHDGSITQVEGELPNIKLTIEIEYLRHIFSKDGDSIIAELKGCTFLEFLSWENDEVLRNVEKISAIEPEILSVEKVNNKAHIICGDGELDIIYEDVLFALDNGKPITILDIDTASHKYWDEWEKNAK